MECPPTAEERKSHLPGRERGLDGAGAGRAVTWHLPAAPREVAVTREAEAALLPGPKGFHGWDGVSGRLDSAPELTASLSSKQDTGRGRKEGDLGTAADRGEGGRRAGCRGPQRGGAGDAPGRC